TTGCPIVLPLTHVASTAHRGGTWSMGVDSIGARNSSARARGLPEDVTGVTERALAEREDLGRPHREDADDALAALVHEALGDRLVAPLAVPLFFPGRGELGEARSVGDPLSLALDHHVQ